jgi:hypothetical protein
MGKVLPFCSVYCQFAKYGNATKDIIQPQQFISLGVMHFAKFASRLVNILSANWQI